LAFEWVKPLGLDDLSQDLTQEWVCFMAFGILDDLKTGSRPDRSGVFLRCFKETISAENSLQALPKNPRGALEAPSARYALHRCGSRCWAGSYSMGLGISWV
jgi:hypothetical protein